MQNDENSKLFKKKQTKFVSLNKSIIFVETGGGKFRKFGKV